MWPCREGSRSDRPASIVCLGDRGPGTIETAWFSMDGLVGESKDRHGRMGAFLSLEGVARRERVISSRPSVLYCFEQGCFMKLSSQRRTELSSSRASPEPGGVRWEPTRGNK
jgi:hypothetical protein